MASCRSKLLATWYDCIRWRYIFFASIICAMLSFMHAKFFCPSIRNIIDWLYFSQRYNHMSLQPRRIWCSERCFGSRFSWAWEEHCSSFIVHGFCFPIKCKLFDDVPDFSAGLGPGEWWIIWGWRELWGDQLPAYEVEEKCAKIKLESIKEISLQKLKEFIVARSL